jgi:hypothetical protein
LLPLLAFLNLFFGWLFFTPLLWIAIEAGLVLLIFIYSRLLFFKARNYARTKSNVIDAQAKVIEN